MANLVQLFCIGQCGAFDRVPAFEDKDKQLQPVQAHPYCCLECWRAGWRHDAGRTFQLPGHPQVVA